MRALDELNVYLKRLELRMRLFATSRGLAATASVALVLTVLLVYVNNRYQFAEPVVLTSRILLFLALAVALGALLLIPISRISRRRTTRSLECDIPELNQRLTTVIERPEVGNPFTELIAEDALSIVKSHRVERSSSMGGLLSFLVFGVGAAAVLIWLITAGPGFWGYGASLLWTGSAAAGRQPIYAIVVHPGNKTIRRRSDQTVLAELNGFSASRVTLHAKYGNALKWEEIRMKPKADSSSYQFLLAGLSDPVEYYVQADGAQSRHFTINVKDLPVVKRVRVATHFPAGLGLKDVVDDPGGDVRAVQGSEADISILTDKPLEGGQLVTESGTKLPLTRDKDSWTTARLRIEKDGSYHVAVLDGGELIRISDDYFIEAKKDEPPSVRILNPGHDPHVSVIEEVPVTISATDDFGVNQLDLHYSVNGAPEQIVPLLKSKGQKEAEGKSTLYFENFKVSPGDVVSLYATARDAKTTSQSEMIFAQAEPFDFKFSQSQQAGGGGGMGGGSDDNNISERQKQIVAATFNELRDTSKPRAALQEQAHFLSDLQGKLSEQAKTLAERMASRELGSTGSEFTEFSKLMTQASSEMNNAVDQLKPGKWREALAPEQKALQGLLRAEALFRNIQVAFGQQSGGGGGGGAQRDLARMFDLELDTSKNQYETGQSPAAASGEQQQKAIDEAFERLKMLAKRQEELAAQNGQKQEFEQRWEEEQLRREAEELRQKMQQLAQNQPQSKEEQQSQQSQQGQQGQQGQQSQGSSGQTSSSSQQNGQMSGGSRGMSQARNNQAGSNQLGTNQARMNQAMQHAAESLQRAENQMRQAVSNRDPGAQQRAAAQLRQAQEALNNRLHDQAGQSVSKLAQQAEEIANAQKELAERMKQMYGNGSQGGERGVRDSRRSSNRGEQSGEPGSEAMPEMNDPNSMRFGYGFRRRAWMQAAQPSHQATDQEKSLASDKEKLAGKLEELQKEMQNQATSMAGSRPDASAKMRRALSAAEQKELALRMQKNAEWIRQGYGERNASIEDSVTNGVNQLSRDLQDVQSTLNAPNGTSGAGKDGETAAALNDIRNLREQLRPGQAPDRQGVQNAISELNRLRAQVDPSDRSLTTGIDWALGNLHHLTGAQAGLLDSRINGDATTSLERLEAELSKRVAAQNSGGARTGAAEKSPEQYRDAVAEYFKRLSQPK